MLYFAYGSNLWKRGMLRRCPQGATADLQRATARIIRLVFRGYAQTSCPITGNIVVQGAIYRLTPA